MLSWVGWERCWVESAQDYVEPSQPGSMSSRVVPGRCWLSRFGLISSQVDLGPCRSKSTQDDVELSWLKPMSSWVGAWWCRAESVLGCNCYLIGLSLSSYSRSANNSRFRSEFLWICSWIHSRCEQNSDWRRVWSVGSFHWNFVSIYFFF